MPTPVKRMTAAKMRKMFSFMFTSKFLCRCERTIKRASPKFAKPDLFVKQLMFHARDRAGGSPKKLASSDNHSSRRKAQIQEAAAGEPLYGSSKCDDLGALVVCQFVERDRTGLEHFAFGQGCDAHVGGYRRCETVFTSPSDNIYLSG